jgi:lipoprotein-releasing system permease protein
MHFELFVAKRILFRGRREQGAGTRPIIRIAVLAVALSMMVMLISIAIVTGFQKEIREKVVGFGAHIQVSNFDSNTSFETRPLSANPDFVSSLRAVPGVDHVQAYALKAGIIKTEENIEGVVLKGIDKDFNWAFFRERLLEGGPFDVKDTAQSNAVLISKYTARRLGLKPGDDFVMFFIQQPPRARKFRVSGIYETGLEELDKLYVLCNIRHIQKLNDWKESQVAGYEVLVSDFSKIDETGARVYNSIGFDLNARTIRELYPQIFDWLRLQDMNVVIIIVLMVLVATINMVSALLIIILERVNMIGILKAMGARDLSIRKVFLYTAAYLTGTGMLIGNIAGLGLCYLQKTYGFIKLSQESYYVPVVPVNFSLTPIVLLNVGTILVCILMLILPSFLVTRITPLKAIRFS